MVSGQQEQSSCPVRSFDEWTRLEEVIVGRGEGLREFHLDNSFTLFYWDNVRPFLEQRGFLRQKDASDWPHIEIEAWVVDELLEDIEGFVAALESLGVRVRRPARLAGNPAIQTPFWSTTQSPALNVRDQTIIIGDIILETAPHVRARLFENTYLRPLFYEYMRNGARWQAMPQPILSAGTLDTGYFVLSDEQSDALADRYVHPLSGLSSEIIFDGAQCIRLGADILVNVANRNHELGFRWLQRHLDVKVRLHRLDRLSDSHIDSMLLPLRPGLWLLRHPDVLDHVPPPFNTWDFIVAPEARTDQFPSYEALNFAISSKFIDMNVLSISEDTVIVNALYPDLVQVLERRGLTVVPVRHRHRRLFGGGFHCFTLDIRRNGGLETYG